MKLPSYKLTRHPGRDRDREKLAAWLAERALDEQLAGDETPAPSSNILHYEIGKAIKPFGAGDIALFKPAANESRAWGPVYALLLERGADGEAWLAVPFSRYATPAVPGEWRTKFAAESLRVLCFWNAREVAERKFLSGAVKRVPAVQLERMRAIYRHVFGMVQNPAAAAKMVDDFGPILLHPADPRYAYLDEERLRLDEHAGEAEVSAEDDSEEDGPIEAGFAPIEKAEWLLAAEGRPDYGTPD